MSSRIVPVAEVGATRKAFTGLDRITEKVLVASARGSPMMGTGITPLV